MTLTKFATSAASDPPLAKAEERIPVTSTGMTFGRGKPQRSTQEFGRRPAIGGSRQLSVISAKAETHVTFIFSLALVDAHLRGHDVEQ